MTDVAGHRINSHERRRRVWVLDTVAARGLIWLALVFVLVAPIAVTRVLTPPVVQHAPFLGPSAARAVLPTPAPPVAPMPASLPSAPVVTSVVPSNTIPRARTASVRDRLAAILSAYQNRDDFGTPESAAQAAGALHWCAQQLASHEQISVSDASAALSAALTDPRSAEGRRVVSAIETPADGADETSRMQCASLLYAQLNAQ
ncbi:MAG: hypothetical protein WAU68_09020 [Vitreimonas sp.]